MKGLLMDTQTIEIIGRNRLVNELLAAGLEVALPLRDHGIDLIAYVDKGEQVTEFHGCPIQMKAASSHAFSINKKYKKFPNLLIAYVWGLDNPGNAVTYALTYEQSVSIGERMGWTQTGSWTKDG